MSDVNKQLLERWAAFGKAMQKSGSELPRHLIADTEKSIAAAEQGQQSKTVTLEQLVANLKAGEGGDAISAAMDQACADMEFGRRMREQAQQTELEPIGELRIVSGVMTGYSYPAASKYHEGTKLYAGQQQAEPVAWEVRNGVATHDFYRSEAEAEEVARDMQKSHDLSGSLAAFNVRPVYAQPPAVAVPDGWRDAMSFAHSALAEAIQIAPLDRLPTMAGAAMQQIDALIAAAQKGGA